MTENDFPDPDRWPWDFETRNDSVGVWSMIGWDGYDQDALKAASKHYDVKTSNGRITGTVAVFGEDTDLPKETQQYISEEWGDNMDGVDRAAFVSEGISAMAVSSNVDAGGKHSDVEWFNDIEEAVSWATDA